MKESKQTHVNVAAIDFMRDGLSKRAQMKIETAINTESNLSAAVFQNILSTVGLDPAAYESKSNLINESLLKRRNEIAHGEYIDVQKDEWATLADEVLLMLRQFKTDIENAMVLKSFRRALPNES
jgi:ribonucleotide reductase beta subunit family protein with ferritin-like domain